MLRFPFWLAVPAGALSSDDSTGYGRAQPYSFSSAEKMAIFLTLHKSVQWETRLVDRYSAPAVVAKLTHNGFTMLRHNALENGSDGNDIALADILTSLQPKPAQNGG
jgi:hypothetical protein